MSDWPYANIVVIVDEFVIVSWEFSKASMYDVIVELFMFAVLLSSSRVNTSSEGAVVIVEAYAYRRGLPLAGFLRVMLYCWLVSCVKFMMESLRIRVAFSSTIMLPLK